MSYTLNLSPHHLDELVVEHLQRLRFIPADPPLDEDGSYEEVPEPFKCILWMDSLTYDPTRWKINRGFGGHTYRLAYPQVVEAILHYCISRQFINRGHLAETLYVHVYRKGWFSNDHHVSFHFPPNTLSLDGALRRAAEVPLPQVTALPTLYDHLDNVD